MSFAVFCNWCGCTLRVLDALSEKDEQLVGQASEFWPDKYKCARCGADATGCPEREVPRFMQNASITDLTAPELYAALQGMGLPKETSCTIENVSDLLGKVGIRVVGEDVPNTGRCVIDYFEFADGSRAYMGASSHGAVVYRLIRNEES